VLRPPRRRGGETAAGTAAGGGAVGKTGETPPPPPPPPPLPPASNIVCTPHRADTGLALLAPACFPDDHETATTIQLSPMPTLCSPIMHACTTIHPRPLFLSRYLSPSLRTFEAYDEPFLPAKGHMQCVSLCDIVAARLQTLGLRLHPPPTLTWRTP